jgi:hypothetical protein
MYMLNRIIVAVLLGRAVISVAGWRELADLEPRRKYPIDPYADLAGMCARVRARLVRPESDRYLGLARGIARHGRRCGLDGLGKLTALYKKIVFRTIVHDRHSRIPRPSIENPQQTTVTLPTATTTLPPPDKRAAIYAAGGFNMTLSRQHDSWATRVSAVKIVDETGQQGLRLIFWDADNVAFAAVSVTNAALPADLAGQGAKAPYAQLAKEFGVPAADLVEA